MRARHSTLFLHVKKICTVHSTNLFKLEFGSRLRNRPEGDPNFCRTILPNVDPKNVPESESADERTRSMIEIPPLRLRTDGPECPNTVPKYMVEMALCN